MAHEFQGKEVFIRFKVGAPNPDGTFHVYTSTGHHFWYAYKEDFESLDNLSPAQQAASQFGTLLKKNGELQTEILNLKDEIRRLEERLEAVDRLKDLVREIFE